MTSDIAFYIKKSNDPNEILELKESFTMIESGIRGVIHHPVITALNHHHKILSISFGKVEWVRDMDLSEQLSKSDKLTPEEKTVLSGHVNEIKRAIKFINDWKMMLQPYISEGVQLFPNIEDENSDNFRESYNKIKEWVKSNPKMDIKQYPYFKEFQSNFNSIPHEKRMEYHAYLSRDVIKKLSDFFQFNLICEDLRGEYIPK